MDEGGHLWTGRSRGTFCRPPDLRRSLVPHNSEDQIGPPIRNFGHLDCPEVQFVSEEDM